MTDHDHCPICGEIIRPGDSHGHAGPMEAEDAYAGAGPVCTVGAVGYVGPDIEAQTSWLPRSWEMPGIEDCSWELEGG